MAVNVLLERPSGISLEPATSDRLERLKFYADALTTDGLDAAQFRRFIQGAKAEARHGAREPLAELIDALLADDRLRNRVIDGEIPVRAELLSVQQELGFPWALEISPEDLELLRPGYAYLGFRWVTVLVALATATFDGAIAFLAHLDSPIAFCFLVGLLHAVFVAGSAISFHSSRQLRLLGWMWLCGPVFTAMMMAGSIDLDRVAVLVLGMGFAFPSMVTAALALGLSRKAPE